MEYKERLKGLVDFSYLSKFEKGSLLSFLGGIGLILLATKFEFDNNSIAEKIQSATIYGGGITSYISTVAFGLSRIKENKLEKSV